MITREKAERLIEGHFGSMYDRLGYVKLLCGQMDRLPALANKWDRAWREMDSENRVLIPSYLPGRHRDYDTSAFLRLLTLHLWIRHDFKPAKKRKKR